MKTIVKIILILLRKQNSICQRLAMRGMQWTGRSSRPLHPKHLYDSDRDDNLSKLIFSGCKFLDLGSGTGTGCINAIESGADLAVGLEYNKDSLALSWERSAHLDKKKINFVETNLEEAKFPYPDNTFDVVNFCNVLEHLHNRHDVLKEICRVTKNNARILISIPNKNTSWKKLLRKYDLDSRDDEDHKIEYSEEELQLELETAGLKIITELRPIVPSFPWHGAMACFAIFSPWLYKKAQKWKKDYVKKNPKESIGWEFEVSGTKTA